MIHWSWSSTNDRHKHKETSLSGLKIAAKMLRRRWEDDFEQEPSLDQAAVWSFKASLQNFS